MKIPVLFIIFNRLDTTKQVFEEIKKAKPQKLYIASDGPREDKLGEKEMVENVRNYVLKNIDWECEVKILFRDKNLGSGKGPSEAITWFFENEEMGIIIENDCIPSQSFFRFCEELLEYYRNDERIGMISGFNPFSDKIKSDKNYIFSKYTIQWGCWATWKKVWKKYDYYMKDYKLKRKDILDKFDKILVKIYWKLTFDIFYYKIHENSWDEKLQYLMFKENKFTIFPSKMLVNNIGFGFNSTHCFKKPKYLFNIKFYKDSLICLEHPEKVAINNQFEQILEKEYYNINFSYVLYLFLKSILGRWKIIKKFLNLKRYLHNYVVF
mgnify:CR=1 FL=1